jgi:hypothetical protein
VPMLHLISQSYEAEDSAQDTTKKDLQCFMKHMVQAFVNSRSCSYPNFAEIFASFGSQGSRDKASAVFDVSFRSGLSAHTISSDKALTRTTSPG